jgi:predicted  nucleic acid-binding Zn-ribbon protein
LTGALPEVGTTAGGTIMARWTPRTPKEAMQASLERLKSRIQKKQAEVKELESQAKQVEQAIKALGS